MKRLVVKRVSGRKRGRPKKEVSLDKKSDKKFDKVKREYADIAHELGYGKETVKRILNANNEVEIGNILRDARTSC